MPDMQGKMSGRCIRIDDSKRSYIDTQKCIGCGACENACPVEETAVKVVPCQLEGY